MPDEDLEHPKRGYDTRDLEALRQDEPPPRRTPWALLISLALVVLPALFFAIWALRTLE